MANNFETIKKAIYQKAMDGNIIPFAALLSRLSGEYKTSLRHDIRQIQAEFNVWLDRLDIRQSGRLIDFCNEQNISLPGWIKNKRFYIDYNNAGEMDLIKAD